MRGKATASWACASALALTLLTTPAAAQPSVLVVASPTTGERAGLASAIAVQLGRPSVVRRERALAGGSLGARIESAAATVERTRADLVVWIEHVPPSGEGGEVVLYAVGAHRERALTQIIRVPAGPDAEVDRVLALKIAELIDAAMAAGASFTTRPGDPGAASTSGLLSLGVLATAGGGTTSPRPGAEIGAGVSVRLSDSFSLQTSFALRWLGPIEERTTTGIAELIELAVAGRVCLVSASVRLSFGACAEVDLSSVQADGTANDGRTGRIDRWVPGSTGAALAVLKLIDGLELRAMLGLRVSWRRQAFSLGGAEVADLGWLRAVGTLLCVVRLP